jgi:tetratricopeptide (TPR) repeat protein
MVFKIKKEEFFMRTQKIYRLIFATFAALVFALPSFAQENMTLCMSGVKNQQAGQYDQAIADLENCIKTGNLSQVNLARTYRILGQNLNSKKEHARAIGMYNQALALSPNDPWNDYVNRGNAWSASGDFQRAIADYEEALKLSPNLGAANFNRGIVYEKLGQIDKAKADISLGYQKGFRSPQIAERMTYYKLGASSAENSATSAAGNSSAATGQFDQYLAVLFQQLNRKYTCFEAPINQNQLSTAVRAELLKTGIGSNATDNQVGIAFVTLYPCPFSPYRTELKAATQQQLEGVWLYPETSQKMRFPPLSSMWEQEKNLNSKCDGIGFYAGGEMRTARIFGAQMSCSIKVAADMNPARQNPLVARWNMLRDGRLSVSRTDVANHIEEWEIFIATSDFLAAGIQIKQGDLVGYMRKERGNELNVATVFWHLQKLP